jgi:hypothetical protein
MREAFQWKIMLAISLFLALCGSITAQETDITVTTRQPGHVFTDRERVVFALEAPSERHLSIHVVDYFDKTILERDLSVHAGKTFLKLGRLPTGYYELRLDSQSVSFAVVPARKRRFQGEDSPLATDGAISWVVVPESFTEVSQLMKRSGVSWVRDRLRWVDVEPERGQFHWELYDQSADAQTRVGLKVDRVFHDTPFWARSDGDGTRYPDDLRDVYRFAQAAARHFRGRVHAWEIWNEAELPNFSPEPADPYAAFFKAASLGFGSVDPRLKILMVSLGPEPGIFAEALFENGISSYMDIYNWHVYTGCPVVCLAGPQDYHLGAEKHFDLMARYGVEAPAWVTEAGTFLEAVDGVLTPANQRIQAEFIPKSFAHSLAAGVTKHFYFIFPHFVEGQIFAHGLLHEDLAPYPGYAALSATTYALGKGAYQGRMSKEGISAFLFDNGKGQTLVLWSDEGQKEITLSVKARAVSLVNVVGGEETRRVTAGRLQLELTGSPIFLLLPQNALQETIIPPEPAPLPERPAPVPTYLEIVARFVFPTATINKPTESYILPVGQETPVSLEIYNFSSRSFQGKVQVSLPEGWEISGLSPSLSIEPMGLLRVQVSLKPSLQPSADRRPIRLQVSGPRGNASPCVAYVQTQ